MRKLTLVAEYLTLPIFDHSAERMGAVEPSDLPISIKMQKEIEKWDRVFQATFNNDYPPKSGFKTEEELRIFNEKGCELAMKLQNELGKDYEIIYLPQQL